MFCLLSESSTKPGAMASSTSGDVEGLVTSIRVQSEQNQALRRVFAELEKELRSLTDTRIALEIKLDFLNTATTAGVSGQAFVAAAQTPVGQSTHLVGVKPVHQKASLTIVPSTPIVASAAQSLAPGSSSILNTSVSLISSTSQATPTNHNKISL